MSDNRTPFSTSHAFLIEAGFTHTAYNEDYHDNGNAESGPNLVGGPAFDEYHDNSLMLYFGTAGDLLETQNYINGPSDEMLMGACE